MTAFLTKLRNRLGIDDWDPSRRLIALCAAGIFILILWGSVARLDEITRGLGKVVPSSKVQLVQAATPATVTAILVRPGAIVGPARRFTVILGPWPAGSREPKA
jgi:adhesin transport system membrane fusion protein